MTSPKRPVLRYHGGKWKLAPWIIQHFPPHTIYVEPFGGAASVLLRKERSYAEVYNDLDGEVVNLFRVLRNPAQARELVRLVTLTPFAREEQAGSYILADDPIEQARRMLVRSFMGYGTGSALHRKTGFRNNATRPGTTPAHDWMHYPAALEAIIERLRGVVIEHRPALDLVEIFDEPLTLFYCDPPYVHETRSAANVGDVYKHEMTDDQHRELAAALHAVRGAVVLSGYRCDLYDELYADWRRVDRATHADGARDRVESLWLSPRVAAQPSLFAVGEMEAQP